MSICVGVTLYVLAHWNLVTHIFTSNLTIIGSDNGLSPGRRQAIILTNAVILLIGLRNKFQWNCNRNSNIFIQEIALESVVCKMATIFSRPQCVKIIPTGEHTAVELVQHRYTRHSPWHHIDFKRIPQEDSSQLMGYGHITIPRASKVLSRNEI